MSNQLKPGDTAPPFALTNQSGETVQMQDFAGQKLLLYFYPRANTPGCTKQSCAVSEALPDLSKLGIAAIGISPDSPKRQKSFDEKYQLGFPLLADEDCQVATAYGALGMKKVRGVEKEGINRSSFLIGEDGTIIRAWYKVKPLDTVPLALAELT